MTPATLASSRLLPLIAVAPALGLVLYAGLAGCALWWALRCAREALGPPAGPPSRSER